MKYENMTDFDINSAVTADINNCASWEINDAEFYHCGIDGSVYHSIPILDYCNNPSDAWPIILGSKISIVFDKHETYVNQGVIESYPWVKYERQVKDGENPLRAAMIVYLMMSDKNDT